MPPTDPLVDSGALDRRQQRLLVVAWGATILPLAAFGYLTWQSWALNEEVREARQTLEVAETDLERVRQETETARQELATARTELNDQRQSTKHYRDFAGIQIRFYRESDRDLVQKALVDQGFTVDATLGSSPLINMKPNTIAFGKLVSEEDLRDIAIALVEAGFPLKRIAPSIRQPDPKLIQIIASVESEKSCGLLSVEQIRIGETCGPGKQ